jgi:hypothetical protein
LLGPLRSHHGGSGSLEPSSLLFMLWSRAMPGSEFRSLHADDAGSLDRRSAVFLCGAYRFAGDIGRGLVEALPPVLSLPASVDDPSHGVVMLLSREMLHVEPGKQTVLDRLLDVLVVLGLRAGLTRSATAPAWFRAASDPHVPSHVRACLSAGARAGTHEVPRKLAYDPRARSSAGPGHNVGRDRRPSGLFIRVCVRDGLPSAPRRASGPLAAARTEYALQWRRIALPTALPYRSARRSAR